MFPIFPQFRILLLLLFFGGNAAAQTQEIDSLKLLLKDRKIHDTTRLYLIGEIIGRVRVGDPIAVHYNKTVKEIIFRNLKNKKLSKKERQTYYYYLGFWYCDKAVENYTVKNAGNVLANYDMAIYYFGLAGENSGKWITTSNKATFLIKLGAYEEAISSYFSVLKQQEAAGDTEGAGVTYSGIAKVYETQRNFAKAISYYKKALKAKESIKDPQAQQLYEKGTVLNNLGAMYTQLNQEDIAMGYFAQALKIDKENGFDDQASYNADQLAAIYITKKNYPAALALLTEGLELAKSERSRASLLADMGHLYSNTGDYKKAEDYFRAGLSISEEIQDLELMEFAYYNLYELYKKAGKSALALEMHEKYVKAGGKVRREAAKNALAQQQLKYDFEKREILNAANAQKKLDATKLAGEKAAAKRNLFIYILLSVAVILGGVIWFLYYFFRQKALQNLHKNNELKQKLLLSQMNPHFIFNSVDNIQSLIYQKKDDEAVRYLTRFSKLTRQILEHSRENYILLSEEIEMLTNYLSIQQLLYNSSFTFEINTDENTDPEMLLVPPMLSQPFIENAIKHGLKDLKREGIVKINYAMKEGSLVFEVTDNGSGFAKTTNEHKSLSTQITRERLESIAPESEILIETSDIYSENIIQGARTRFAIPFIHNN